MRINIIVLLIIVILLVIFIGIFVMLNTSSDTDSIQKDVLADEFKVTDMEKSITENIFNDGCVRNEKDAADIGKIILKSVYGKDFDNGLPLLVSFDNKEQNWLVKTQLPEYSLGGSKYLIIKKENAEVVAIWATK